MICKSCGAGFYPSQPDGGEMRCPECSGGELLPAGKCAVCDEILPISELDDDKYCGLCSECRAAAVYFFRLNLGRWFTRAEINYLNKVYDGRDLGEGIKEAANETS